VEACWATRQQERPKSLEGREWDVCIDTRRPCRSGGDAGKVLKGR